MKRPNSSRSKIIIAILAVFILLAIPGYFFRWNIYRWYDNLANNHYAKGDKIYATQSIFNNNRLNFIPVYRQIRPLTEADINKMQLSQYDKLLLIKTLDPSGKPYMIMGKLYLREDKMFEAKTACIGLYIKHVTSYTKFKDQYFVSNFYALAPNNLVLKDGEELQRIPPNYTLVDSTLYVISMDTSDKEPNKRHI